MAGFYDMKQFYTSDMDTFEKELADKELLCSICYSVPKKPYTSTLCCGMDIVCMTCLDTHYKKSTNCITCRKEYVKKEHFIVNLRVQKMIMQLPAVCILGCDITKPLEMMLQHQEKECMFRSIECVICSESVIANQMEMHTETCMSTCDSCHEPMYSKYIKSHKEEYCTYRNVKCIQDCPETIRFNKMDDHIRSECRHTVITCPIDCGTTYLRMEEDRHVSKCDNVIQTCPLCSYSCYRKEMSEHMKDRLYHMEVRLHKMEMEHSRLVEENKTFVSLFQLFLPDTIETTYFGKKIVMQLSDLSRHHCDFCQENGNPNTIPLVFGKHYGYHFENLDKCLSCAKIDILKPIFITSKQDLNVSNMTVKSSDPNIIGCRVTEGPDWRWGNQSGISKIGTIVAMSDTPGWARVKWDTSSDDKEPIINTYRIGSDHSYDLVYIK